VGSHLKKYVTAIWHKSHLFAKIVAAVVVLFILAQVTEAISFYINDVSGGLDTVSGNIFSCFFMVSLGLVDLLIILIPICLIVSIIKKYKSINISLTTIIALITLISQNIKSDILQTNEPLRHWAHNKSAADAFIHVGLGLKNAKHNKDFIFTRNWGELNFTDVKYLSKHLGFALNENLLNKRFSQVPNNVVVIFESDTSYDEDKIGGPDDISTEWHITQGSLIVFGDGKVEFVKIEDVNNLQWKP
jgi:hypothetical protein